MARKSTKRKKSANPQPTDKPDLGRRQSLTTLSAYGAGAVMLGGGGVLLASDFADKLCEHDLSVIGQGTPVVLQIHDPQCALCQSLQKQTRKALRAFDEEAVLYRVANIRSDEGAAIQAREGLPHVSLVLYCGRGERRHVIQGVTPSDVLVEAFEEHLNLRRA